MAPAPHERPFVDTVYSTADLPDTPQRDYRIPASGWLQAPSELLSLGDDLGEPVEYKRRIGRYLLWRAGPPVGEARYLAVSDDGATCLRFDLHGRRGEGSGPDGARHTRFRTWKEALHADGGGL
ncbi:MAG: hypothetical protein A2Z12_08975 [Actinobacteria bacterium RBG_16_68_21]|nr:MAG: hypothetical protein A2Z12_08975 [Actinobacteria bacterium RBG_16_68_21]